MYNTGFDQKVIVFIYVLPERSSTRTWEPKKRPALNSQKWSWPTEQLKSMLKRDGV